MPGCIHACLAAVTTALHGGLSERGLTTGKLNPMTTAKSRANTVTGVHAATTGPSPRGAAGPGAAPLGTAPDSTAGDASPAMPRGRSIATIATYRSSAGATTYRGCTTLLLLTISPTNSPTLNTKAVIASGQCGAVSRPSAIATTATTIAHAPQIRASCPAISGMLSGTGEPR